MKPPAHRRLAGVACFAMAGSLSLLVLVTASDTRSSAAHAPVPSGQSLPAADGKKAALQQALERRIQAIADSVDGVMGYEVMDLTTGARFGRLQNEVFPTASTIKIAILYELFKQADERRLNLDEPVTLDRRHVVGGSGVLAELTAASMPLRDYATLMIVLSDNTAANFVIDTVGMTAVTTRMAALGLPATKLRRRMMDVDAARRGDENVSTPAETARLLEIVYRGHGFTKNDQGGLLGILRKAKTSPMRRSIPDSVSVANKPGELDGVAVDAGIVYLDGRPYIFSAMLTYLKDGAAGEAAIEEASRVVYEHFARLAGSSEYGRTIR